VIVKPPFHENDIKPVHSFSVKPYTIKRPRTQGIGTTSIIPYKNTEKNGYVRFNFHQERNPANLIALHHTYPLYMFPHVIGTTNFVDAPDGIYTWVLVYPPVVATGTAATAATAAENPVFVALQVHSKMELGSGHAETIERLLEIRPELGFKDGTKTMMNINYSGELEKTGHTIKFNILSGTYMLEIIEKYRFHNFGGRNATEALNEIFATKALTELNRLFAGQLEVIFNHGITTLITSSSVPLMHEELERYSSRGHANVFFLDKSLLSTEETIKPINVRWAPFFGSVPGASTTSARRRKTRRTCRKNSRKTHK